MTGPQTGPPNEGQEDTRQHELVIIRRRSSDDEAPHKGGVWKIAHADFMTALMAFFLVMWLINATDEKTISGVANYFNPMRMSDSTTRPKGVFTMEPGSSKDQGEGSAAESNDPGKEGRPRGTGKSKGGEAALFDDPMAALDGIAAEAPKENAANAAAKGDPDGHNADELFRDPFDPDSRYAPTKEDEAKRKAEAKGGAGEAEGGAGAGGAGVEGGQKPAEAHVAASPDAPADLVKPIEKLIEETGFSAMPGIEITSSEEGVLISISDQQDFEMFGVASARPKPELVVLMENIGNVLRERSEPIVIRGHTDSRKFKSGESDNWRLSSSRAQMAYYMLMRAGVPDERVDRIEGHADRELKNAEDPFAGENRRIEILLQKGKS